MRLLKIALIFMVSPSAFSSTIVLGDPEQFEEPFEVGVTIIERLDSLIYWALPLEEDEEGIKRLKAFIEKSRSNNYMANPLLFQFRIAGLKDGHEEGLDFSKDDFRKVSAEAINKKFEGKLALLTCYGSFKGHVVPYCTAVDTANENLAIPLIAEGLLLPDHTKGKVPASIQKQFDKAAESAKADKNGVWKPFHSMFRGIK